MGEQKFSSPCEALTSGTYLALRELKAAWKNCASDTGFFTEHQILGKMIQLLS